MYNLDRKSTKQCAQDVYELELYRLRPAGFVRVPQGNFVTRGLRLVTAGFAPSHLCSEQNDSPHNAHEIVRYPRVYPTQDQATNEHREKKNPRILSRGASHARRRAATIS